MTSGGRVLIVSNRVPVVVRVERDVVRMAPASGGLATGLRPVHEGSDSVWIGWTGDVSPLQRPQRASCARELAARRIVPIRLSRTEAREYYDGICNGVLWPVFHYQVNRIPLELPPWASYQAVNERFAEAVVREYRDGDLIWIHDYHLLLVPALVRQRLPDARIGFFLHIPFPAPEVFQVVPWRREIIAGLLGADVIGFHTTAYAAHFEHSVRDLTAFAVEPGVVFGNDRQVRVGAYPMGVDADWFTSKATERAVLGERSQIATPGRKLLLGVDRLDYTKGIPRRLLAYERLLRDHPDLRGRVELIQVAVPSREGVLSYTRFRQEIDELVGRINGDYATVGWTPVRYLHQAIPPDKLVALYGAADVMLVTPLRDGMNLVAKEFIASRPDEDGVLVLSEFAGAASQLPEALLVNPYSSDEMVDAMARALTMDLPERRRRMSVLRQRVASQDVTTWASTFLADLYASHAAMPWRSSLRSLRTTSHPAAQSEALAAPQ